ncbi:GMC family oxidoreductase [Pseudorhodoferax sp. Leaf274]|uniref:GMC family oxidoreductase n=1 Tax=Pseudorhodoferax sp. Leaf274 TaxID=1736318 RepID=UPI0007032BF9|nr:GMC family oxidoreductase N-terminal domain-containing protein [Pseudorhodoferax sp. Leaf274]KQP39703.1 choline dehydrogenase [Pseudorhodoferax sp. Leaf274]
MSTDTFDYVIVGSGAAGAILAARLGEDPTLSICVLEAGPRDWHPYLHLPAGFIKVLFNPDFTWQFSSEPTDWTGGRRVPLPQGRTAGGSTAINGLVYNRGQAEDYDGWAAQGNPGWSHAELLPYFMRSERRIGPGDDALRGRRGPVPVTDIDWRHPVCEAFLDGAGELGLPRNPDYNGATQAGVGYFQRTIRHGLRQGTAPTFLTPALKRGNVALRSNAHATGIVFDGRRATGVRYRRGGPNGPSQTVRARREVIVCAGAVNSPKLLQLSGIGPAEWLQRAGIPVRHALPGVGQHLKDHFSVRLVARAKNTVTINELARAPRLWSQAARWLAGQPSILALSPSLAHFFWQSRPGLARPDLQGVFAPASYRAGYVGMLDDYPGMTCGVWQHRPQSSGWVRLASGDPFADPLVQPNYLAHEDDRRVLLDGVRLARQLLQTRALAPYVQAETLPGPDVQRDDELLDYVRRYGVSSYHLNGTARMGPASDAMAVVDAQLRVHGVAGLRVADASVMPEIPSANTCAASMMIGEKAADLVRAHPATP